MNKLILSLLIFSLLIVVYQDLRTRQISTIIIPVLLILLLKYTTKLVDPVIHIQYILTNLLFVFVEFFILYILKINFSNDKKSLFDTWIGLGDLLFIILLALTFSPNNFLIFLITGLIIALFFYYIFRMFYRDTSTIPLAGILSIELILVLIISEIFPPLNPLQSTTWIQLFDII